MDGSVSSAAAAATAAASVGSTASVGDAGNAGNASVASADNTTTTSNTENITHMDFDEVMRSAGILDFDPDTVDSLTGDDFNIYFCNDESDGDAMEDGRLAIGVEPFNFDCDLFVEDEVEKEEKEAEEEETPTNLTQMLQAAQDLNKTYQDTLQQMNEQQERDKRDLDVTFERRKKEILTQIEKKLVILALIVSIFPPFLAC